MARLLPYGQYAFVVALLALPIRATYLRCARLLPLRAIRLRRCAIGFANTRNIPSVRSAIALAGNTPSPLRYWLCQYAQLARLCAHCVARIHRAFRDRSPSPTRIFFTSAVGRCPFPLAMHKTPAPRASLSPRHA